jgi:DNA-binding transcriptional ArsR family regulator
MSPLEQQAERLAALGHPIRLSILRQIVQGALAGTPAGEIQQALGIPASTLSHHLGTLSAARLVAVERQGTTLRYRADFDTLKGLTAYIWEDCCRRDPKPAPEQPGEPTCCALGAVVLPVCTEAPATPRPATPRSPAPGWSAEVD